MANTKAPAAPTTGANQRGRCAEAAGKAAVLLADVGT
jgi:hypothetical protein